MVSIFLFEKKIRKLKYFLHWLFNANKFACNTDLFPSILLLIIYILGFPVGSDGKESTYNVGDLGLIPGLKDSLEKVTATHSSIPAWRIAWTE